MHTLLERIKQDISKDVYYGQNFANEGQQFLAWYLRNVCLRTPVQARDDITDGADDKEIDAIIIDDEKRRVVIIQGKFYGNTSVDHEPLHEVLAAWHQIHNLPALQENANNKLKIKLEAVSVALQDDYDVEFELVTTGELTPSAQADLATFQSTLSEADHPEASIMLVDEPTIIARWDDAMARELPKLSHTFALEAGRYLALDVANYKAVLAAVRLEDCVTLPGIREGTLFRKNVRQSLGLTNRINKGLKQTINGETPQYFFLYHNGITALCEHMDLDVTTHRLHLDGLSVVNGCQSLNTILACSEKAKKAKDAYVLFRFYEIPQRDVADRISINTNSQSAVKARDLRSNDKRVLAIKRAYENMFRDGYFITKRGEERPADRDERRTIDIAQFAKCLMAWHCQRPIIAPNENRLFDKHFDILFKADYPPSDILALHQWAQYVERRWKQNDLGLNEALASVPSYAKFHLLFAIQACFCVANNQRDKVPIPSATSEALTSPDGIIMVAANCFNSALDVTIDEFKANGKIFNSQNWLKSKDSILKVQSAVNMYLAMAKSIPGSDKLMQALIVPADKFTLPWSAD